MCEAATIIAISGLVLSAAATATSVVQANAQANSQKKYQTALQEAQNASYLNEATALRQKQQQEADAAALESQNVQRDAQQARSRAATAAGEAGVSGQGVDAILGDFSRQEAQYLDHIHQQQAFGDINTNQQLEAARTGAQAAMTQTAAPIARPNLFAAALQIGKAGLDSYSYYRDHRTPDPNKPATSQTRTHGPI